MKPDPEDKVGSIAVHPMPIVASGRIFGKDGWKSTLLQMPHLIIGHHGSGDGYLPKLA